MQTGFSSEPFKSVRNLKHKQSTASEPDKTSPVVCILGASFGTGNMGVNALAASTVIAAVSAVPKARVFFLDYGKIPAKWGIRHGANTVEVERLNLRFSWKPHLTNNVMRLLLTALVIRWIPSKWRSRIIANNDCLQAIHNSDILCSLAGGDSFSDIYGMRRFFYVCLPQLLVIACGKPLTLMPQTLGPFKGAMAQRIAAYIMRKADWVYARDKAGLEELRRLAGAQHNRHSFSYDMAFVLEPAEPPAEKVVTLPRANNSASVVGFNVSGLLWHGGYSGEDMFGLKSNYRELVLGLIRTLIQKKGAHVILLPHVFATEGKMAMESDPQASRAIYDELKESCSGRLHLLEGDFDQSHLKAVIGRCDFFLGSRMHACIGALSQGIPAIGLAYSKKFAGVLGSIGVESLVLDLRICDAAEVESLVAVAYEKRELLRSELLHRMPQVKATVLNIFSQILERRGSD